MFWDKKELYNKLKEIHDKMDRHDKENDVRLDNIEKVMIVQEQNLKEHMKRSHHLEEIVENEKGNIKSELEPIKRHISMVHGGLKALGFLTVLITGLAGILKLFGRI
jgi:hypothetical protein